MGREHYCHALGCTAQVPPRLHMCGRHWRRVPKRLQRALWASYVPGQERTLTPSPEYLRAAGECVRAVAEKEGVPIDVIDQEVDIYEQWAERLEEETDGNQE